LKNKPTLPRIKSVSQVIKITPFWIKSVKTLNTTLLKVLTVLLALFAATSLDAWTIKLDTAFVEPPARLEQAPHPKLIEIASLGHTATWIDALLLRSLGDPAYDPVIPGTHPPLYFELMLATALDPDFVELYSYGASILSIVRRDGPGAAELLERAHQLIKQGKFLKNAAFLEIFRGYNALFETQDLRTAAAAFEAAAQFPGSPGYLKSLNLRLQTPEGRFEVAFRAFESLLTRKNDAETQRLLEERLASIRGAHRLYTVNEEFKRWLKSKKPSPELFARFKGAGYGDLRWDAERAQVETQIAREPIPGFY